MSSLTKDQILDAIAEMSVMDVVELVKAMEDKFGVTAAAPVAVAAAGGGGEAAAEEQTEFDVMLTGMGANKISVIKAIRSITGLGLKEAKVMVESAPIAVKEAVSKGDADKVKEELEAAGASAEVK